MHTTRARKHHARPDPVFWSSIRTNLPLHQQVAQTARMMDARLRRELPTQWVPALDIIMPRRPVAKAIGAEWDSWNLARVDAMRAFEHAHKDVMQWTVGDGTLCDRARACANTLDDMLSGHSLPMSKQERLDTVLDYCERLGVEPPIADLAEGVIARAVTERWWRRALRKKAARISEHAAIKLAVVHRKNGGYASDEACRRRVEQNKRNTEMLKRSLMRNEAGQVFTLAELAARSVSNRDIRRGELMTRIRGCEEFADAAGHIGLFLTLTCPSRFHAVLSGGKSPRAKPVPNRKYEDATPREAQAWLCDTWARARAKLGRKKLRMYGFRVAEPHHDGCPHWHMLLWFETPEAAQQAETIIRDYWLKDAGDEPGALANRTKFIAMTRGGAAGYVAKYVAKNIGAEDGGDAGVGVHTDTIDGFEHVMDTREYKGWQRVDAWAATWGIRQFQPIGQPSVTVWRELRRVTKDQIEHAQMRLDFGDAAAVKAWHACQKEYGIQASWRGYVAAQGGMCRKRREWMLRPAVRVTPNCRNSYGEVGDRKKIVGVETRIGYWLISRRQAWASLPSCNGEAVQDPAEREALGRPWTGFNNCTARLRGETLRQLLQGDKPTQPDFTTAEIAEIRAESRRAAIAKAPRPAPEPEIHVIDGIRTTFRMPARAQATAAACPATTATPAQPAARDDVAAISARLKALPPALRALLAGKP
ncbi:MAG: hypothetical protein GAK30_01550 [Paracidovorax wautersii]|uniref:Replication gene A protein-like domain-containing protein n=1 Tax=Paracidovorax wautersii TaxID=1177982 RepID=A0A7V8FPW8_9BURK|nr:MAG: hypothetical protein GAK30_01550 [Paracidovorax wautersii]